MLSASAITAPITLDLSQEVLENEGLLCHLESLPVFSDLVEGSDKKLVTFPVLDPDLVTYDQFFENYLLQNRPCMFTKSLTSGWPAMTEWIQHKATEDDHIHLNKEGSTDDAAAGSNVNINFGLLSQRYGNCAVNVSNCNDFLRGTENSGCQSMTLAEYVEYWKDYIAQDYPSEVPCLYLKDWHLLKQTSEQNISPPYVTPPYFASDWLNEACVGKEDDFCFAYMGPKGSWTPFHADVYGSFSWSANVVGTKKWWIYPPEKERRFQDKKGDLKFRYNEPGVKGIDFYEVIQEAGQVIFVPSGWHHAVWNLEDTISINHNWINGANIGYIWATLKSALGPVQRELEDLVSSEDFAEICQDLLLANHGMSFSSFLDILSTVLRNRRSGFEYMSQYATGLRQITFDVNSIRGTLGLLRANPAVIELRRGAQFEKKWLSLEALL